MVKQDVLDAINATIVPNGVKGITAQSLNNVLTMMTENAGEGGSGDGALRVIVPELMTIGRALVMMGEFSPASWEEMKLMIEADGIDASEYDAVVKAAFEHNANVAQQIIAKAKAGQGASVVLDQTPYFTAAFNIELQMMPELAGMYEDFEICGVQPAALFVQYAKLTPEGEAMMGMVGEMFAAFLVPSGYVSLPDSGISTYSDEMLIQLNLDGSLVFIQRKSDIESGS